MDSSEVIVLIVDDNPTNLRHMMETLRDSYQLRVAKSGEQALELAKKELPDIILLDVMMPGMDGYEVMKE